MKFPFYTNTPLKPFPYNSRVSVNEFETLENAKNYTLCGFLPGNALQASELNEIQETFYKNLTLHNILLKNWLFVNDSRFTSGSTGPSALPLRGPSWVGAVPLDPFKSVTITGNVITFKKDWYLVDDKSGIKFWIYNNESREITVSENSKYIGLTIFSTYITPEEDVTLKDNSDGHASSLSIGADRYSLNVTGTYSAAETASATTNNRSVLFKDYLGTYRYLNNLVLNPT